AFVHVDKCEHCVYFGTTGHARFFLAAFQGLADFIIPAAFPHEFVPDINLVFRWPASFIETPPQNFLIAAALTHSTDQFVILDMQKFGAELIETSAEIALVVGGQFVFLMRANLVEHASEIDKTTDFCRWAANAQLVHRLSINDSPGRLQVAIALTDLLPARPADRKAHDPVLVD